MHANALTLVAVSILAADLAGQLAGDYTIDPGATRRRNFKSFGDAMFALRRGVTGPVRLLPVAGTFRESLTMTLVSGSSAKNTITVIGHAKGTKILPRSGRALVVNARHVILSNLELVSLTSGAMSIGSSSAHVEIRNCILDGANPGGGSIYGTDIHLHDNEIRRSGYITFGQNIVIERNRFEDALLGIYPPSSVTPRVDVRNNLFTGAQTQLFVTTNANAYIAHNTFRISGTATGGNNFAIDMLVIRQTNGWPRFYNNIVSAGGTAGAVLLRSGTGSPSFEFDFNLYDTKKGPLFTYKKSYTDLRSWQIDSASWGKNGANDRNSLVGDPRFMSSTSFRLHPQSIAINRAKIKIPGGEVVRDLDGLYRGNMRDLGAYELAGYQDYGAGCRGTGGNTPFLEIQGDVGPGKFTRFYLSNARPGATPFFLVGMQRTKFNLGGSCELLTIPLVVLRGTTTSPTGASYIQFNLPLNQAISGLTAFTQYAVADPGAGGLGFAMTRGGSIRL